MITASVAVALFAAITSLRFVWESGGESLLLLNVVPVALVAAEFGLAAGTAAGLLTFMTWFVHGVATGTGLDSVPAVLAHAVMSAFPGVLIGWLADKEDLAQRELHDTARKLRFIAEESSDMISTHCADGRYLFVSDRCRDLLGYEPHELIDRLAYDLIHPGDHDTVAASHAAVLDSDDVASAVYRIKHRDDHHVWVETRSRVRRDPATGAIAEIHCTTRDVTDEHLAAARTAVRIAVTQERLDDLLAAGGPEIVYQPIKDLVTGETIALEALARFPEGPPDAWFRDAWEAGRGLELELRAIRSALRPPEGTLPETCFISVNASPSTLQSEALIEALGALAPRVVVELTEHAIIADLEAFRAARARLRRHGVRLAIDDVGAGFSGLQLLLDVDPDILKLDLALSRDIDRDPKRRALARALIAFAESADMLVVAEGIETGREIETLRALGIAYGQGYHLGRPTPLRSRDRFTASPESVQKH